MKFTNRWNLPPWVIAGFSVPRKPVPRRIGVTELIDSPLVRQIKVANWDEITIDYSDLLASETGTWKHQSLEEAYNVQEGLLPELKLEVPFDDWTVVGKIDLYVPSTGTIIDHKFVKVGYATMHKAQLTAQLNCYAELMRHRGHKVNRLVGDIRYCKDWDWKMAAFGTPYPYPPIPYETVEVDLWSHEVADEYIRGRLLSHSVEGKRCSPEERWEGKPSFAVMSGRKPIAKRVCHTREEALAWAAEKRVADAWIQERPGGSLRCKLWKNGMSFCNGVREFCPYKDMD